MKKSLFYLLITIAAGGFFSCSKTANFPLPSSSLTVVNVVSGGANLYTQFYYVAGAYTFKNAPTVTLNSFKEFGGYSGDVPLSFFKSTDTVNVFLKDTVHLELDNIYTLFLAGTVAAPDTFFYKEVAPTYYASTDSVIGVRFANLSKGSSPISVNIKGDATTLKASNLAYKAVTAFQSFSVAASKQPSASYIFEIRDQASGTLLTSYTLSSITTKQSKNVTIVLKGIPKGTGTSAQGAVLVNNY